MIYIGGKIERVKYISTTQLASSDNTAVVPTTGNLSDTPVILGNDLIMTTETVIHNLKASFVSISNTEKFNQLDESAMFEDEVGYAFKNQNTRNYFLRK